MRGRLLFGRLLCMIIQEALNRQVKDGLWRYS